MIMLVMLILIIIIKWSCRFSAELKNQFSPNYAWLNEENSECWAKVASTIDADIKLIALIFDIEFELNFLEFHVQLSHVCHKMCKLGKRKHEGIFL